MGDRSSIEWTEATWNPLRGCSIVSEGCRNCYAMRQAHRMNHEGGAYEGLTRMTPSGPKWTGEVRLVPELLDQPLRWRKPRRIFVNSMSDLFHPDVSFAFIEQVWDTMFDAPQHVFQILTKRPERMVLFAEWMKVHHRAIDYPNVWLGTSVEDQPSADERIPHLLATPAAVRWLSCEPLLGPLDLVRAGLRPEWKSPEGDPPMRSLGMNIDWVVVGGESGPGARPFDVEWARSIIAQCRGTGVPVFVKQLGANVVTSGIAGPGESWPRATGFFDRGDGRFGKALVDFRKGGDPEEWPKDLRVREYPTSKEVS